MQEEVVSFFEAVARVNAGLPVIDKNKEGLDFLFTMKQNEYFVFPDENFNPNEIDLLNPNNAKIISPHLFYVQALSIVKYGNNVVRDFIFRHHLDSLKKEEKSLKNFSYFHIKSLSDVRIKKCIKVRINHLGKIVKVGEY